MVTSVEKEESNERDGPPSDAADASKYPLDLRKRWAANALEKGTLSKEDVAKVYGLPKATVHGIVGYVALRKKMGGGSPPQKARGEEIAATAAEPRPNVVVAAQTGDGKVERLERELADLREKLNSSGRIMAREPEELEETGSEIERVFRENQEMIAVPIVQKVITNAKNIMYFDYARNTEGYQGDFGDLVNDCIEDFFRRRKVKIKIEREVN